MAELSAQVSSNTFKCCLFPDFSVCYFCTVFWISVILCELLWCRLSCRVRFLQSQTLGSTCSTGSLDKAVTSRVLDLGCWASWQTAVTTVSIKPSATFSSISSTSISNCSLGFTSLTKFCNFFLISTWLFTGLRQPPVPEVPGIFTSVVLLALEPWGGVLVGFSFMDEKLQRLIRTEGPN